MKALEQEGRSVVERLGGRWSSNGGMCRCPAHDDRTPSLSVRPGRRRLLFHCFAGCQPADVLRALESGGLLEPAAAAVAGTPGAGRGHRLSVAALRIWSEARSIRGTAAEAYLAERGLRTDSPQLRYHSRTPFGPGRSVEYRPALIAAVRDETGLIAIQRTLIDRRSDDVAASRRCALGRLGSGAVRLGGAAATLGLAEGIETALSATALFGVPCWATLGTERFGQVSLPARTERLLLFLDRDGGGRRAEILARRTFAELRIESHYPARPGDDWNDVLRSARAGGSIGGEEAAGG